MREEDVTRQAAEWLSQLGWHIISIHVPGTQGGLRLRPDNGGQKSEGSIIPDIIAVRDGCLLLLESKPRYYAPDAAKLRHVVDDPSYRHALVKTAAIGGETLRCVLIGVCFSGGFPARQPRAVLLMNCDSVGLSTRGVPPEHRSLFE